MQNKEWMKYLSKEQIDSLLEKCKSVKSLNAITDENMLAEWTFHWYDDCFCTENQPAEEDIQAHFNEQYNDIMSME
jgi:flagellar motor switch protein FliM